MTDLTHEQARELIQLRADQLLGDPDRQRLDVHLEGCSECHAYAENVSALENLLRNVAQRRLEKRPAPLSMQAVLQQVRGAQTNSSAVNLVATRSVAVVFAMLALVLGTWQFSRLVASPTPQVLVTVLPTPIPAAQLTHTSLAMEACEYVWYEIRADESLESIARQFGVSESDILTFNQMPPETFVAGLEIKIPLCKSTPTINAPTTTITITPQFTPITITPG